MGIQDRSRKWASRLLVAWLVLALTALSLYGTFARPVVWQAFYFDVWLMGIGLPLWLFRRRIRLGLRRWKWAEGLKFVLLAYGMVLLEEIFAALFNHLTEGFDVNLYLVRIGQFWTLNIFAFTGLITASALLYRRVGYTRREMFILVGLTGLYSEKVIFVLTTAPVVFAVLAPIEFMTYGLIISPALMSVRSGRGGRLPALARYGLFFVSWFIFSVPCILLLAFLRLRHPDLFPPVKFVP